MRICVKPFAKKNGIFRRKYVYKRLLFLKIDKIVLFNKYADLNIWNFEFCLLKIFDKMHFMK